MNTYIRTHCTHHQVNSGSSAPVDPLHPWIHPTRESTLLMDPPYSWIHPTHGSTLLMDPPYSWIHRTYRSTVPIGWCSLHVLLSSSAFHRDTELAQLPVGLIETTKVKHPEIVVKLITLLGEKVLGSYTKLSAAPISPDPVLGSSTSSTSNLSTIAIVPMTPDVPISHFTRDLCSALSAIGKHTHVCCGRWWVVGEKWVMGVLVMVRSGYYFY